MKISAGDYYGWSEIPASRNTPDVDLSPWMNYVKQFKGLSVLEAQKLLQSQQVKGSEKSFKFLELMDMGLLDLAGRLENKPAIELLGLNHREPVPGLYCILHKDEDNWEILFEIISEIKRHLAPAAQQIARAKASLGIDRLSLRNGKLFAHTSQRLHISHELIAVTPFISRAAATIEDWREAIAVQGKRQCLDIETLFLGLIGIIMLEGKVERGAKANNACAHLASRL